MLDISNLTEEEKNSSYFYEIGEKLEKTIFFISHIENLLCPKNSKKIIKILELTEFPSSHRTSSVCFRYDNENVHIENFGFDSFTAKIKNKKDIFGMCIFASYKKEQSCNFLYLTFLNRMEEFREKQRKLDSRNFENYFDIFENIEISYKFDDDFVHFVNFTIDKNETMFLNEEESFVTYKIGNVLIKSDLKFLRECNIKNIFENNRNLKLFLLMNRKKTDVLPESP